jgi:hypothetical protein
VNLFVNPLIEGKAIAGGLDDAIALALRAWILGQRGSIKARGRFGCGLLCNTRESDGHYTEKQDKDGCVSADHRVSLLESRFAENTSRADKKRLAPAQCETRRALDVFPISLLKVCDRRATSAAAFPQLLTETAAAPPPGCWLEGRRRMGGGQRERCFRSWDA